MADNFALANRVGHLIVQPADLELNPPESYLFVQDGLIISCGVIYALCYLFIIFRAFSDRALPGAEYGSVQFLYVEYNTVLGDDTDSLFFLQFLDYGLRSLLRNQNYHYQPGTSVFLRVVCVGLRGGFCRDAPSLHTETAAEVHS